MFTPSVNPSDQTIDNFGPKVNVKVFEEDKEVEFPVGKITVSSKHATQAKVCASKPNKKELTKKMVTNPKKETPGVVHFQGERVSNVKIRFSQYDNNTNTSIKRIKMELGMSHLSQCVLLSLNPKAFACFQLLNIIKVIYAI